MFSDINNAWKNKPVKFIHGKHKGKTDICAGFRNYYGGAGLLIECDSVESIMVYSRNLDDISVK